MSIKWESDPVLGKAYHLEEMIMILSPEREIIEAPSYLGREIRMCRSPEVLPENSVYLCSCVSKCLTFSFEWGYWLHIRPLTLLKAHIISVWLGYKNIHGIIDFFSENSYNIITDSVSICDSYIFHICPIFLNSHWQMTYLVKEKTLGTCVEWNDSCRFLKRDCWYNILLAKTGKCLRLEFLFSVRKMDSHRRRGQKKTECPSLRLCVWACFVTDGNIKWQFFLHSSSCVQH